MGDRERWRWRAYGSYSEYEASEVGVTAQEFTGQSWSFGGELIWNIYQDQDLFLDLVGGIAWENIQVTNDLAAVDGDEDLFLPHAGLRVEHLAETSGTQAFVTFEWTDSGLWGANESGLSALGRNQPDADWLVIRWSLSQYVYLEPLLNRQAWEDMTTPETSTLAHELAFLFRGQHAFGDRLIPQDQQVAGGFYTVRGYPESVVAGDTVLLGTAEYRYHVPRAFEIQSEPASTPLFGRPFRFAPQQAYGRPDWDLILRAFLDVGYSMNSDALAFEEAETLIGTGVGIELLFRQALNVRADWGVALEDLKGENVTSGSTQFHIVATIVY